MKKQLKESILSEANAKQMMALELVQADGLDLSKDYFELGLSDVEKLSKIAKKVKYRSSSSLGRSKTQAFWYFVQRAYNK